MKKIKIKLINPMMLSFFGSFVIFFGFIFSCSHQSSIERGVASKSHDFYSSPDVLENILDELELDSLSSSRDLNTCKEDLDIFYNALKDIRPDDVDPSTYRLEDFERLIDQSFSIRLNLREQIKGVYDQVDGKGQFPRDCLSAFSRTYLALRYVEDYLIEIYYHLALTESPDLLAPSEDDYLTLMGEGPYFNVNPKFDDSFRSYHDLKSGDVILSRGNAYTSAAIARIGSDNMQFSHISLVYEHPSGELYTVEAHIEIGSFAAPLQQHLDQRNARTVVFRHDDQELAHQAAKKMYEFVINHQRSYGENVPYNFQMDFEDTDKLFCSEIVYWAYLWASDEELSVPRFRTRFEPGLLSFLQDLQIAVDSSNIHTFETFSPGDMQFEVDFELVAEWRNPAKVRDSRYKDIVLTQIFEWMMSYDYEFQIPVDTYVASRGAWFARRLPIVKKLLEEKFPLNMTLTQLELFMVLDKVGDELYEELERHQKKEAFLTPIQLAEVLNDFRQRDLENFKQHQVNMQRVRDERSVLNNRPNRPISQHVQSDLSKNWPSFHQWFRPNN